MKIFKYETDEEKEKIIANQTANGLILIEVANIGEGNFIGFDDRNTSQPIVSIPVAQATIDELQANQQSIKDGMADMFIAISSIPGVVF